MAPGPAGCRERQRDLKSAQRWELGPWEYNIFYWFMLHHLVQCDCGCRHLTAGTLVVPLALLLPPPGPPLLCSLGARLRCCARAAAACRCPCRCRWTRTSPFPMRMRTAVLSRRVRSVVIS